MMRFIVTVGIVFFSGLYAVIADTRLQAKIAYLAHVNGFWQVWVMNTDGGQQRQVTRSRFDKTYISWYPDGQHLLVNDNNGHVNRVNIQSGHETPIELPIKGTLDASISPDGQRIVFSLSVAGSIDNNHIWVVDVYGENLKRVTNMGGLQHEPVWSPDQQWIYFLSGIGDQSHDIWKVSIDGKTKQQLTANQLYHFDIALSKSQRLAYSSNVSGNYELWMTEGDKAPTLITENPARDSRPSWSFDENTIVFESSRQGVMNIFKKDLKTQAIQQLTDDAVGARFPVWWGE